MTECLRFDPATRPTFAELRQRIDDEFAGVQFPINEELNGLPKEDYKLGMAAPRRPPQKGREPKAESEQERTGSTQIAPGASGPSKMQQ